ncbi:MAG: hypothetical protein K8T91_25710 [Planctomycetes bacterium]|nr:hypothetical protein [Planctomycetota bacterium]
MNTTNPTRWEQAPIVEISRPRCPACGTAEPPEYVRSEGNGDGSTTRKAICRSCQLRFKVVVE